jgi:hypothetical protein
MLLDVSLQGLSPQEPERERKREGRGKPSSLSRKREEEEEEEEERERERELIYAPWDVPEYERERGREGGRERSCPKSLQFLINPLHHLSLAVTNPTNNEAFIFSGRRPILIAIARAEAVHHITHTLGHSRAKHY